MTFSIFVLQTNTESGTCIFNYGPPVIEIEISFVICSVISLKIKIIVSLTSPGLFDATRFSEQIVVPGDISLSSIACPVTVCVEDTTLK